MYRILAVIGLLALLPLQNMAQGPVLTPWFNVSVTENGQSLKFPFAGGLDQPQFSEIDLNGDGHLDLFIFDRAGYKILTFLNGGTPNTVDYDLTLDYEGLFPNDLEHFALLRDFNCDGKLDIFTSNYPGIRVYRNNSNTSLSFVLETDTLMTNLGAGSSILAVPTTDVPALEDIDGDGDLDLLTFDSGGNFVEYHKNEALENTGSCSQMQMSLVDQCWGHFQESSLGASITLGISCRMGNNYGELPAAGVHAGSSLAAFDEDGDGDYDLVLGDLISRSFTFLRNGGTIGNADMDSVQQFFPSYNQSVELQNFPAAFFLDVNNDGKKDMIGSSNATAASVNNKNVWYYENVSTAGGVELSIQDSSFLQRDMIDVGTISMPAFFDYNQDGKADLFIGNFTRKEESSVSAPAIALYENTGTQVQPAFTLVTQDFESLSSTFSSSTLALSPTFGDLDGDSDMDMIIGDSDGYLHYFENIAASGADADFVLAQAQYKGIDVGQFATPCLVDLDRDGKLDLVVGELGGTLNYFHNVGTTSAADFGSSPDNNNWGGIDTHPVCCTGYSAPHIYENLSTNRYDLVVGSEDGNFSYYEDIESQLGGNFSLTNADFGNLKEGFNSSITSADLNNDGKLEWVTGNKRGGISLYSEGGAAAIQPAAQVAAPFELYPNPSSSRLNIRLDKGLHGAIDLQILDLQGRSIREFAMASGTRSMDLNTEGLMPGIYFIRLQADGRIAGTRKWVLIR